MTTITKYLIGAGAALLFFLMIFMFGCQHGKKLVKCPTITTNTIVTHDTVPHNVPIYSPWYIKGKDSIVYVHDSIPIIVDSAAVVADYYAKYYSSSKFEDSLLLVNEDYMITQNKYYPVDFKYKYKGATTIINNSVDNSVTYQSYFYLGGTVPFNGPINSTVDAHLATPKSLYGISYGINEKSWSASYAIKIFTFKKKK